MHVCKNEQDFRSGAYSALVLVRAGIGLTTESGYMWVYLSDTAPPRERPPNTSFSLSHPSLSTAERT